jgi:hypothetical protein
MDTEVFIPTSTYLKPLTESENKQVLETQTRRAGGEKEYAPITWREQAKLFFNDIKSRLRVGTYIDRAQVVNTTDSNLGVIIAGQDIGEYLPDSVKFVGWKITDKPDHKRHETDHMSSFYDPYSHTIGLPIEKSPEIHDVRLFQDLEYSGLVGLHEVGHARDDKERPDRLNNILKWQVKSAASTFFTSSRILQPDTIKTITESGQISTNDIDQKIESELKTFLGEVFLPNHKKLIDGIQARKIDQELFLEDVSKELTDDVKEIFAQSAEFSKLMDSGDLERFVKERCTDKINEYQNTYDQLLSDETAKAERNAWAKALIMAREITKEKGGVLWNKSLEELFFYIDSSINDHGKEAGRKGIKNPNMRSALNINNLN